jgi:hypothetical protein
VVTVVVAVAGVIVMALVVMVVTCGGGGHLWHMEMAVVAVFCVRVNTRSKL